MQPTLAGLVERLLHDFGRNTVDLDIHLQRGDAIVGAGDLEIHIAEVILVTENIGQYREIVAFLDQAHRDTRDRRLQRHTRVHQGQARAANARHRRRTVRFGNFRDDAKHVGKLVDVRHHGLHATLGEAPMPDLATLG